MFPSSDNLSVFIVYSYAASKSKGPTDQLIQTNVGFNNLGIGYIAVLIYKKMSPSMLYYVSYIGLIVRYLLSEQILLNAMAPAHMFIPSVILFYIFSI